MNIEIDSVHFQHRNKYGNRKGMPQMLTTIQFSNLTRIFMVNRNVQYSSSQHLKSYIDQGLIYLVQNSIPIELIGAKPSGEVPFGCSDLRVVFTIMSPHSCPSYSFCEAIRDHLTQPIYRRFLFTDRRVGRLRPKSRAATE